MTAGSEKEMNGKYCTYKKNYKLCYCNIVHLRHEIRYYEGTLLQEYQIFLYGCKTGFDGFIFLNLFYG